MCQCCGGRHVSVLSVLWWSSCVGAVSAVGYRQGLLYLGQGRLHGGVLLQLEELADEVLLCQAQRLQLTEDLLEDLNTRTTG